MKHFVAALGAIVVLTWLLPQAVDARTVVRSGEGVIVAQDERIEGDFYVAASTATISGEITDDLLVAAGAVTLNGTAGSDVFIVGASVDVHGSVGDDVRIIGGDVTIAEPVSGDVFIFGGTVQLLSTASVAGDVLIFGGTVEISAPIEGKLLGHMTSLRLDSSIVGDVDVTTDMLTLGERAVIGGNVRYVSNTVLERAQGAQVAGDVVRNDLVYEATPVTLQSIMVPFLVILFSVAVWYLIARRTLNRVVTRALLPGIRSVLIGTLTLLLTPFAVSILLVSMLGTMVGVALLASYILLIVLAIVSVPATIGKFVQSFLNKDITAVSLAVLVIGSLLFTALLYIPIVGPIVLLGFFILQFGAMVDLLIRASR
jgi:cytoskeletal protein CcmA (bactofilin family)/uncharacterized membrane protein